MRSAALTALLLVASAALALQQAPVPSQAPSLGVIPPQAPPEQPDPAPASAPRSWLSPEPFPEGAVQFPSAEHTQQIYQQWDNETQAWWNHNDAFPVSQLAAKWRMSGGMEGIFGWRSDKYRMIPRGEKVEYRTDWISVGNGVGSTQQNKAITRRYPDGTRFDDVLSVNGTVFEHRVRRKENGQWKSEVIYKDKSARPKGYTGLRVSCASCHSQAGTGEYAQGLVPGGDSVISDPLEWGVWASKK